MRAFVFDSRIGKSSLVDKLLIHNSRFLDIVRVDNFHDNYVYALQTNFRNLSPNSKEFELFCLVRYYYAYKTALDLNISENEEFFLIDSDIKVINADFIRELPKGLCFSQCVFKDRLEPLLSPHFSKWNIELLKRFCQFILNFYSCEDKILLRHYRFVQDMTEGVSGLSDMYLLYLFVRDLSWTNTNTYSIGILHNLYSNYVDQDIRKFLGINLITRSGLIENKINVIHYQGRVGKLLANHDQISPLLLLCLAVAKKINDFMK